MQFPYISQIQVNNCFTYQNFQIPNEELSEFKHIILTGKNGSGKTTILNRVAFALSQLQEGNEKHIGISKLKGIISANQKHTSRNQWEQQIQFFEDIDLQHLGNDYEFLFKKPSDYIFSFFKANRLVQLKDVDTVTREAEFISYMKTQGQSDAFISSFKQYLVNKKVYEAFNLMNNNIEGIKQSKDFFNNLTNTLKNIFNDNDLELEFVQESFEFFIELGDKRKVTFNQLSEGFSAFLSILMDLLMRTDLLRKSKNNFNLEPEGIVLIDEPETHFHLSMQYQILPLINELFPKIQLIVATHSPAIISSLKNAVVFDLSTMETVSDWVLGSSFSELMIKHFGLDNEYSSIADKIIYDINSAVKTKNTTLLKQILISNENYLTPSLRLEIESQMIHLKKIKTNDQY